MTQLSIPGTEPVGLGGAPSETPAARRTSVDRIIDTLLREMSPSEVIGQLVALRPHAVFNALLAIVQLPHATMLRTEARWDAEWGRQVRPGQHPIVLLAPFGPVELYFDVSQTEPGNRARPLPVAYESMFTMTDAPQAQQLQERIIEDAKKYGVRVVHSQVGTPLAGRIRAVNGNGAQLYQGHDCPIRWVITLAASHSPTEQLATLTHELGHLFCGHLGASEKDKWSQRHEVDPATKEFEAESVTQLVLGRLAPATALPAYSGRVLNGAATATRADWVHIAQAADRVLKPFHKLSAG
ncbi:ImmA/IrrE family metallo-endopeptidase [Nocardioides sp. P86]|uniref:ImmA/IrrE family metallo-endopeptidase n=1 Tax=Nocardioides sp. P86 TaxID=2939569 RepID=UPI00203E6AC8|nr:ImmA/IrrE family metallo-endopeptidase [Nocardioides sp. P86]MCM3513818.1 ImmA/IrrE family metallo-endopeptidase [Nocardioides sp. P86]